MTQTARTVLIIDDEQEAADLFEEMLLVKGYRTIKTEGSTAAVKLVADEKPDTIILDIMVPFISGLETLRMLKLNRDSCSIPIVVVSEMSMPADIKAVMAGGASIYLTKPVGFLELVGAIEKVLEP